MNKCHVNINWVNDTTPAINDTNLNYMDGCIDILDDRVITLDMTKAEQSDLLTCVAGISYNTGTGIMTIALKDGTTTTIDTGLAKLSVNFDYDDDPTSPHYEQIIIEMADGTFKYVDLSALITQFEFGNTDTIAFTVDNNGHVTASVRDGSITGAKLQPNYLADVTAQANAASASATTATSKATLAESYAVGGTGTRPGEDTDNAKYYKEQAAAIAQQTLGGLTDVTITNVQDGDIIKYRAASGEYVNVPESRGILPHIIVISETGSTVTATKGTTVISAVETTTEHFEMDVPEFGTWTIDSILSGDDAQVSLVVDTVKVYTVDDTHFHADITVSYPSAGTCSLSAPGQTTLYATGSPYTFTVHEAATYTLTATYRGVSKTKTMAITTSGQTETESFLVDGATATPTDVISTWLDCAYLWDKNYTTLAEVIGDSETLLALISNNNAVDYMARSETWASAICADALAMLYIGQYNYCADSLLANSTWLAAILDSQYCELVLNTIVPVMTSNTTPSGNVIYDSQQTGYEAYHAFDRGSTAFRPAADTSATDFYVGYEFTANTKIYGAYYNVGIYEVGLVPTNFVLQAYVNNAWETVSTIATWSGSANISISETETSKMRFKATRVLRSGTDYRAGLFNEVQFYGREDVIPPVSRDLKTFAAATDAEILEMVCKADRGEIDLYDDAGWRVGQEHAVSLSAIASSGSYGGVSWTVGEAQAAQTATLVLMHKGLYELVNPVLDTDKQTRNTCSFIAGLKDCLATQGYINSTNTNSGSWNGSARRSWCNGGFRGAMPSAIRAAFKQFKTITATEYNAQTTTTSNDYFALFAEKEILGSRSYSNTTEASALTAITWYETSANRVKTQGDSGSAINWFERSPHYNNTGNILMISSSGTASGNSANHAEGISPFGCL